MSIKIESLKLQELQNLADKYQLEIQHVSEKTGKMINKTKLLLIQDIKNYEQMQKEVKVEINRQKEEKQEENHQIVINSLKNEGQIFYDDEFPPLYLIWTNFCTPNDEDEKRKYLEPSNLESKFNIKLTFGSFLRFKSHPGYIGSDFYIVGHDKKIIECNIMANEESMIECEFIIIPREITKYLNDALTFFNLMNREKYIKKIRNLPKKYLYKYSLIDDIESSFDIGCVQLSSHDVYLHKHISNIEIDTPILFDYRLSRWTDYDYKLFVFIPYLGIDNKILETENYSSWIDTYTDIYGKYSFLKKNNIDFQKLKSMMMDYQTIKSTFSLKTDADLNFNDEPCFGLSLEKVSSHNYEKDESKFNEVSYLATTYEAFLAEKNVREAWKEDLLSRKIWIKNISFDTSESSSLDELNKNYYSIFYNYECY